MTPTPTSCAVCSQPSERRLCSSSCVREAVHERERNVRLLRTLRRNGDDEAGADLVGRNAVLTGALLTQRPLETVRSAVSDHGQLTVPDATSTPETLTQPFATPVGISAAAVGASRPVA